ncbi:MAG: two-component system, OmpR family, phosphate regulon sensor histidine kinase PhoR, partial [Actinomycetota bacterium]|nr:two-component system, OmpR family, phosphate regulon sensor histidine kinase PhoR [Actinomycetota bacterium]
MTLRRWLPAAGIGMVLSVGAMLAAFAVADAAANERRVQAERTAPIEAKRIAATVERDLVEMEVLAASTSDAATFRRAAQPRVDRVRELVGTALARRDGARLVVETAVPSDAGPLATGFDLAADPRLAIVINRALIEAQPAAGTPFEVDHRPRILVAAPVFARSATDETSRRASVTAVVVGAIDSDQLLAGWIGPIRLVAPDARIVGGFAKGSAYRGPLDIRGRSWLLLLDAPAHGWPLSAWAVLVVGLLASAVSALVFDIETARRRRAEDQARDRARQLGRIADAGARLQQTLDLAELLPAFAVSLAEDFALSAVSIALIDSEGALTEAFATGEHAEGASVELPLRRGWRAVGVLTIRPGRTLDDAEQTSLQALADLLAVAMSNAQLYEREQLNAARLRDLDALKNAFLGTVSHELRTSMTAIMGFGELLADAWDNLDDERRREMANRIRRSAGSLRHLVDDLLDFARLEQERLRVSPRNVDLAGIVRQTVDNLTPLLGKHEVDVRAADAVPAWADPVAVERILANLISNAAKYSPPGTTVTVIAESFGDCARLVVADQGPGIPPEERRRIFARFYRLDTPESVRTRGAGIGLAILRDFADRSAATVVVDDAPGGGSRFTVDFPTRSLEDGID